MNQEEKNGPAKDGKEADEDSIILTEENAPVIFEDSAEAHEDDIELIDLTEGNDD